MSERHRLGRLEMREAGHDRGGMRFRLGDEDALKRADGIDQGIGRVANEEPEVRRHLIVARARSVQPPSRRADDVLEAALDVHMYVFECAGEFEASVGDLGRHLIEPVQDLARVAFGDDAGFAEHRCVRLRAADVLRRQHLVE